MNISPFNTNVEKLREQTLLGTEALDRILDAPKLPLPLGEDAAYTVTDTTEWSTLATVRRELIRLVLMSITYSVVQLAMRTRRVALKERQDAIGKYHAMVKAFERLRLSEVEPPSFPVGWQAEVEEWIEVVQSPKAVGSGPRSHIARKPMAALLLGFFVVIYQVEPGTGDTGPALRFLEAFYRELHLSAQNAVAKGNIEDRVDQAAFIAIFEPLAPEGFRQWIRDVTAAGRINEYAGLVEDLAGAIVPQMRPAAGSGWALAQEG